MALTARRACAVLMALSLTACAVKPIPIDHLTYRGTTTVKTNLTARVIVTSSGKGGTSSTYLMPAGGVFIPYSHNTDQSPLGDRDVQAFSQSLRQELVRTGVVKAALPELDAPAEMLVTVNIDRAVLSEPVQYTVLMTMLIRGGATPFRRQYFVNSAGKDSYLEKMGTNGAEARVKVAHLMMEQLIPDIESYGKAMTP